MGACAPPPAPSRLTIAHEGDVLSLDPAGVAEVATQSILSNVFESLVTFDREMRLVPGLAVQWSTVDDNTWVIELREGVLFHDGRPLQAADVRFTLLHARDDPASGVKGQLSGVTDVEIVDARTIRLHTREPDPLLMNRLTYILVVSSVAAPGLPARPLGTGPYRFVRWEPGRTLDVEAFEGYWGPPPEATHVSFVPVREGVQSLEVLRSGAVDVLRNLPETLLDEVERIPGLRIVSRPGLTSYYLWINSLQAEGVVNPLADARVRRAISLAIDRGAIVERLGSGTPADQLVQPGVFGYVEGLPGLGHDPDAARRLLAEAGYPNGLELTLAHRDQMTMGVVVGLLVEMLGDVGVRLTPVSPPWSDVVSGWAEGTLPFFLAGWRFENGDAHSFLQQCLFSRNPEHNTGSYNAGYSNPALDALIRENGQIFGEANRLRHYQVLMASALEELPFVPLYHRPNLFAVSERVRWQPRLDGKLLAAEMSFVR